MPNDASPAADVSYETPPTMPLPSQVAQSAAKRGTCSSGGRSEQGRRVSEAGPRARGAHLEGDRLVDDALDKVHGEHLVLARAPVVDPDIHVLGRRAVRRLAGAHVAARNLLRDVGNLGRGGKGGVA